MKKILSISIASFFVAFILVSIPKSAYAIKTLGTDCSWTITDENGNYPPNLQQKRGAFLTFAKINLEIKVPSADTKHKVEVKCTSLPCTGPLYTHHPKSDPSGIITDSYSFDFIRRKGNIYINVSDPTYPASDNPICTLTIEPGDWKEAPTPTPAKSAECELSIEPPGNITNKNPITIKGRIKNIRGFDKSTLKIITKNEETGEDLKPISVIKQGPPILYPLSKTQPDDFSSVIGKKKNGFYTVKADLVVSDKDYFFLESNSMAHARCSLSFDVCDKGCSVTIPPTIPPTPTDNKKLCINSDCYDKANYCHAGCEVCWKCRPPPPPTLLPVGLCDKVADPQSKDQTVIDLWTKCDQCEKKGQIWTAIGCLPISDVGSLMSEKIFPLGLGIAGGTTFLYFLYGAFLILTSAGNAERIEQAKQIITSSLSGLLLIVFSVFLLKIIGADILKLPEFK